MAFQDLASELVHQVYNHLHTVSDVINLSLTCHRFNSLLRNAHKLSTLFAAADREFGPIKDIERLVTYIHGQSAAADKSPPMSYALLRQIISVGIVGKRFEQLYPSLRWDTNFLHRRQLTSDERFSIRRALYRYWLYSDAFHNQLYPRTHRLLRHFVEERSQLLRNWSNEELIELEEVRLMFEDIITLHICPTDGAVRARALADSVVPQWHHNALHQGPTIKRSEHIQNLFHSFRDEDTDKNVPPAQARLLKMEGWGDDITQYHVVQSMLKLNPAQIIWLHDHAIYKWQVEALIRELGEDWFWNNGQTLSDTWSLVLHTRGVDVEEVRGGILDGCYGSVANMDGSIVC